MSINMGVADISYFEELSMFSLNDEERTAIKAELEELMSSEDMMRLAAFDTGDTLECVQPLEHVNDFREDELLPPFPRELILQNAKERSEEMFVAPRTVS